MSLPGSAGKIFLLIMRMIFALFILCPLLLWAQKSKLPVTRLKDISVHALNSERDNENDTMELEGQVQVIYQQSHLTADVARINMRSKTLDAIGNVLIITPNATIGGTRVTLDYETNTGIIYHGYVQSGNVIFEGEILHKVSENSYIADKGKYTTCTNCPETWSFTGSRIRAELGGYAYIKNSVIRFGGFPSLWLPYLIVPLQSGRQTGLLTPQFEHTTKGGLAVSNSFFWAIDRSQDATITLKNYELRGLKSLVNYRYVLSEHSQGELDAAYMVDRAFANEKDRALKYRPDGDSFNRWFLRYNHYYDLPDGYVQRMQFNNTSDLQYPSDFFLETQNNGDSAMESRTSLTKNTDNQHFSVDASYFINLLQADPFANNNFAVHRLPELRYSTPNSRIGLTDFLYSFDLNYTNFARNGQAWDTMNAAYSATGTNNRQLKRENGGGPCNDPLGNDVTCEYVPSAVYDPTKDLLRTGQRLDAQASLSHPILFSNFLDIVPKLSYRETQYAFPISNLSSASRRFIRGELASKLSFSRVYDSDSLGRFKHEIQPELTASANSPITSPNHPFFGQSDQSGYFSNDGLSDLDLNGPFGIQFDYNDRLSTSRLITFSVTNKLTRKVINGDSSTYYRFLYWKIAQSYDAALADSSDITRQPYSDVSSTFSLYLGPYYFYQSTNYYPYQQVTNSSTRVRLYNETGDFAELEYKDQYNIFPGKEATINARDFSISLKKDLKWVDLIAKVTYNANPSVVVSDYIKSSVYGAKLKLLGDCLHLTIVRYKDTRGDWNDAINFDFSWDGNKIPRISDTIISSY